ncbi:MFS transporter [Hephaestia sp. GCM10023244]|uniref:MFS transporter n=1 Tax=unclassified Hephaestia TaxID=2631281 RepID=UPI002077791D|nr:MFS transporter [Hephaestia sp. MAHUQ-44]MCM8732341.1 MFS transporter [Hephaestia sp. MAHUQ-44]
MTNSPEADTGAAPIGRIPRKVWVVLGLLLALGVLNYFERQTLSILKPVLKLELAFDDAAYSFLTFAFMLPYIIMYAVSGRLIDRFGTRISMTVFATGWSLANIASGLSRSFAHLATARAFLGVAEPGAFPVIQRAILNWVPLDHRAFALSIVTPAGSLGAILAPPLVALLATSLGWRAAFVIPGVIGVIIAIVWWCVDTKGPATQQQVVDDVPEPLSTLFRDRNFWAIVAARMVSDPVWFFYLFWIPGYLQERVGLSLGELGLVGGLPYICALIACVAMGRAVDRFAIRGHDPVTVQLRFFCATAALMPLGALITMTASPALAIVIICVVISVCQSWFVGFNVLLAGLFPVKINGSALGILGAVGASTALVLNLLAGSILQQFDYVAIFAGLALLHPIAALILMAVIARRRSKPTAPRDT